MLKPNAHDQYDINHIQACSTCMQKVMLFDPRELLNQIKQIKHSNPVITTMLSSLNLILLIEPLRRSILKSDSKSTSEIVRFTQPLILNVLKTKKQEINPLISIHSSLSRFLIIQDSIDSLKSILYNFHISSCKGDCPIHNVFITQLQVQRSCKIQSDYGDNSCCFIVNLFNEQDSVFSQFLSQINRPICFACKQKCTRSIFCIKLNPIICFRLKGQVLNYSRILPQFVNSNEFFQSKLGLFKLRLVIDSNQEIFLFENSSFIGKSFGSLVFDKFFIQQASQGNTILAVFYEFSESASSTQKVPKVTENLCKCGRVLNIGENDCAHCETRTINKKEMVQKTPNAKYAKEEEKKSRPYNTNEIKFKSKVTKVIYKE